MCDKYTGCRCSLCSEILWSTTALRCLGVSKNRHYQCQLPTVKVFLRGGGDSPLEAGVGVTSLLALLHATALAHFPSLSEFTECCFSGTQHFLCCMLPSWSQASHHWHGSPQPFEARRCCFELHNLSPTFLVDLHSNSAMLGR